jgi:hypothetical protein
MYSPQTTCHLTHKKLSSTNYITLDRYRNPSPTAGVTFLKNTSVGKIGLRGN